jgi:hypothetical protein
VSSTRARGGPGRPDRLAADGGLALRIATSRDLPRRLDELAADAIPGVASASAGRYRTTVSRTFPEPSDLGGRGLDAVIADASSAG